MKISAYFTVTCAILLMGCDRSRLGQIQMRFSSVNWNANFESENDTRRISLPTGTISWEMLREIGVRSSSRPQQPFFSYYEVRNDDACLPLEIQWTGDNHGPTQVIIRGAATTLVPGQNLMLLLQALSGQNPNLETMTEFPLRTVSSQTGKIESSQWQLCVVGQHSPIARIELKIPRKDGIVRGYGLRLSPG